MLNNLFLCFKLHLKNIVKYNKNVLYKKILFFKKPKWDSYKFNYSRLLKLSKYRKYKIIDHKKNLLYFFGNKTSSYSYKYKDFFNFYIKLKHLFVVKNFKKLAPDCTSIIKLFELKIDFIILQSKFCFSLKLARQNILNNNILINYRKINLQQYFIKSGDILKFYCKFDTYKYLILKSHKWPVSKYILNYKIKELFFVKNLSLSNFEGFFSFYLKFLDYNCGLTKNK